MPAEDLAGTAGGLGVRPALAIRARPGAPPLGLIFGGLGVTVGGLAALLHIDRLPFTVCIFKAMTGWPCMSCGSTRAVVRLASLDLAGALAMNPLATMGVLGLLVWAAADLFLWPRGRALAVQASPPVARLLRVLAVTAVLVNWAYLVAVGR
jgi:uncharacterized protein DUF2752